MNVKELPLVRKPRLFPIVALECVNARSTVKQNKKVSGTATSGIVYYETFLTGTLERRHGPKTRRMGKRRGNGSPRLPLLIKPNQGERKHSRGGLSPSEIFRSFEGPGLRSPGREKSEKGALRFTTPEKKSEENAEENLDCGSVVLLFFFSLSLSFYLCHRGVLP